MAKDAGGSGANWYQGTLSAAQNANQNQVESRLFFTGTTGMSGGLDLSRSTDAREKGRLGLFGTAESYAGSYGRVTSESIGRDLNPLGRGDGGAYVGGELNLLRIAPRLPLGLARVGFGNSANNVPLPPSPFLPPDLWQGGIGCRCCRMQIAAILLHPIGDCVCDTFLFEASDLHCCTSLEKQHHKCEELACDYVRCIKQLDDWWICGHLSDFAEAYRICGCDDAGHARPATTAPAFVTPLVVLRNCGTYSGLILQAVNDALKRLIACNNENYCLPADVLDCLRDLAHGTYPITIECATAMTNSYCDPHNPTSPGGIPYAKTEPGGGANACRWVAGRPPVWRPGMRIVLCLDNIQKRGYISALWYLLAHEILHMCDCRRNRHRDYYVLNCSAIWQFQQPPSPADAKNLQNEGFVESCLVGCGIRYLGLEGKMPENVLGGSECCRCRMCAE